jgi:hypothetical protein
MQNVEEVKVTNIDYDVIVENIQYQPRPIRPTIYTSMVRNKNSQHVEMGTLHT